MAVDYAKLGLKVGLELHQQLKTAAKLFCSCKPELRLGEPELKFMRRLRPTQSELGQVDPAALFEFQKGRNVIYEADDVTSCLVELDEEPPHSLNQEAVDICLTVAQLINAEPVDEVHVMRKIVIDGSNTTGFQRTCIIALGGFVDVDEKRVPIQTTCLEEDAARPMGIEGAQVHYSIDRLGIPLIEVATAPVIHSPKEAETVALVIGRILRATGKMRRGIGTIRQDINISIPDGALIEIKGVQKLELVSKVVEYEVQRQLGLLNISKELKARSCDERDLKEDFTDVTEAFRDTRCKLIRDALGKGGVVMAVRLPRFTGQLGQELQPNLRLGTEMADRARFWGRVGGLFHTDELPGYGIDAGEVDEVRKVVEAKPEDAVVIVADKQENVVDALKAVVERAREALFGVPEETRGPNPDGTTRYMRPRPGAARMYPETDIPTTLVTEERLTRVKAAVPELPERMVTRFMQEFGLNRKLAEQVVASEYLDLFERLAGETRVSASVIAVALTETMKSLEREGVETGKLADNQVTEVFKLIDTGLMAKESIPEVFTWLSKHEGSSVQQALEALGLKPFTRGELEAIIEKTIAAEGAVMKEKGLKAMPYLMGAVMRQVRGKADAKVVNQILGEKLRKRGGY